MPNAGWRCATYRGAQNRPSGAQFGLDMGHIPGIPRGAGRPLPDRPNRAVHPYAGTVENLPGTGATLLVFCRRPGPGVGKQRLAPLLGAARTLELARLLLAAALEDAAAWPGAVVLAPAAAADTGWAAGLLARPVQVIPQPDGNLGERLMAVDRAARAAGHQRLLFIGSDAPVLDLTYLETAGQALSHRPVVLGPAADGGVTLMGNAAPWPELADLPWSSGQLATALATRCEATGLPVSWLAPRYDVDLGDDLAGLARDLADDPRPVRQTLYRWLRGLGYS